MGFHKCTKCGKDILPNEECFDYEWWGRNEIIHYTCAYPNNNKEEVED